MHKILIIEDELLNASRIKRLLLDIDDTIEVYGPAKSIEEVVEILNIDNNYDLILSDIRLSEHLVFEAFHEVMPKCPVIFTTAYEEYAIKAFRNNGIDYLLKPIDADELLVAYKKAFSVTPSESTAPNLQSLSYDMKCYRTRILVCKGDELIPLKVSDISYIHTENNNVIAFSLSGTRYQLPLTMAELEDMLNPDMFFRLNRQYIANAESILKISLYFNSKLCVRIKGCDDNPIIVSKEKSAGFRNWLNR